ncbi:hypothetical protein [Spirochaeta isovalerica]|uniref:Uncharacterized protein (UPF0333 family) n=1 Tax=Spirochaeta isovalerica TaxID=150 RepID=A0A841R946_9SPIO|nr:hypothetical protein [Spirochaeta isovalerica]MBB6479881.1 uncharacterized protein (UPF0333 family) [Spirochaeta isovalerica]
MKKIALLLSIAVVLVLSGCSKASDSAVSESESKTMEKVDLANLVKADTLNINFAMGNNSRTMTYQKANPLTLPDGTVVSQGDLKPTWQYIEKELGLKIADNAVQDQKASEMIDIAAATSFSSDTIYGGNSIAESLMKYGAQGYLINLKDYLDYMPHVKEYLESQPNIAKAITAFDGGIYHLPYAAELGNYARAFVGRPAWVTALLDSTEALEAETHTLKVAYEGYWDRFENNVIDLQNKASKNGMLDQSTALNVLKDYIAEAHPDLDKPSDLYVGETAVYDIDELIALWRVIELSPRTLSKVSTGKVVADAEISPYFVRHSKYREDLLRMMNYFDGQRVHGSDSYAARQILEGDKVVHSYAQDSFLENLNYIQQWYQEGLIHSEFADLSIKDNFRTSMFFSDDVEGQRQFGFMTYDWFASTTAGSDKMYAFLPPVTTVTGAGINDFIHYVGNARAIKPDGWAISAKADEPQRNAALALFDYMYSEDGNNVQNYSIPEARVEGAVFKGPDGTEYPKFSQWLIDTADEFKNGDISGFLRDFMGSHLALGYQKEIGFELQYTSATGFAGWDLYTKKNVLIDDYEAENPYFRMMPPVISLNEQDVAKLGTTAIGEDQVDKIFIFITGNGTVIKTTDEIAAEFKDAGLDTYESVYTAAYKRMTSN